MYLTIELGFIKTTNWNFAMLYEMNGLDISAAVNLNKGGKTLLFCWLNFGLKIELF